MRNKMQLIDAWFIYENKAFIEYKSDLFNIIRTFVVLFSSIICLLYRK